MRGKILDNTYLLLEEIGRGGFGAVYRAVRIGLEGSGAVAVKLLNNSRGTPVQEAIRFQREATFLSQLLHPGIVTVHELGEEKDSYYIVMEFVSGPNLRDFVKHRGGRLSLPEVLSILIQAAEALEYVHSHGIIHRDIKPQNILISELLDGGETRSQAKLVDFGVARLSHNDETQRGKSVENEVVGTYSYMAPESTGLINTSVDSRADVYSLGMVGYELLAGKSAFLGLRKEEMLRAHISKAPAPISEVLGYSVPPVLEKIVLKCLEKSPENRYQSMFGLVCDLKHFRELLEQGNGGEDFELGKKDIGFERKLNNAFVARSHLVNEVLQFHQARKSGRLSWALVRGGVGTGKTRFLSEIRRKLESENKRYLHLKFNESEQRLPYQALGFAINDYLSQFEKTSSARFRELAKTFTKRLGDASPEIARLIPSFRPYLANNHSVTITLPATKLKPEDEVLSGEGGGVERDLHAIRIYQTFFELFSTLVGKEPLVFLLDDVHLADASTLSLFQFLAEQVNQDVHFGFVLTTRDRYPRSNFVFENFLKRVASLKRRFQSWDLNSFDFNETRQFLEAVGVSYVGHDVVEFFHSRTKGTPLQLQALTKRLFAEDVIYSGRKRESGDYELFIRVEELATVSVDVQNIEVLLASLEALDRRDLHILQVAAVANEACEFDYFAVDAEFSEIELETRLQSVLKRGYLEMIGDANAPLKRRAFVFTHEKIRNAVLSHMDDETRREIHFRLAMRIMTLYRNPRREQLLALAKHFDGAGQKADGRIATKAFLRAVRVFVQSHEYPLARYYIDRSLERVVEIAGIDERMQRLREVYEAEYTIYASQGNLVAASEVCRQLLDITTDPVKKETLQVFWCQLLLGLGRHSAAFREAYLLAFGKGFRLTTVQSLLMKLHFLLIGTYFYRSFCRVVKFFYAPPRKKLGSQKINALSLMTIAQFHGREGDIRPTLYFGMLWNVLSGTPSRFTASYALHFSAVLLRKGMVEKAYRLSDQAERYLEVSGMSDALRWTRVMRALWLDYPMGRTDRLLPLFHFSKEGLLPSSGIMHFESYGLRAWMRLVAPMGTGIKDLSRKEELRRRKADRDADKNMLAGHVRRDTSETSEGIVENKSARRILDVGENGQYTSYTLFADSFRFALGHRIESLRRTIEQLRRQPTHHSSGEVFARFSYSMQALISGRHKEALNHYIKAIKIIAQLKLGIVSLPVADGMRLATLMLPLLAVSMDAQGWPFGKPLLKILLGVDGVLRPPEGEKNPRRNAMTPLYAGFVEFLKGDRSKSFALVEAAIKEARTQKLELIECLALSTLGTFCAMAKISRAREHLSEALRLAHAQRWKLIVRQVHGVFKRANIKIEDEVLQSALNTDTESGGSSLALNHALLKMQRLNEISDVEELLSEALNIAAQALNVTSGYAYLLEPGRMKFMQRAFYSTKSAAPSSHEERFIQRWLSRGTEEPVRFVKMEGEAPAHAISCNDDTVDGHIGEGSFSEIAGTMVLEASLQESHNLVLIALTYGNNLLGWLALPHVSLQAHLATTQIEQDLLLLGLHVGHLINKVMVKESEREIKMVAGESPGFGTRAGPSPDDFGTSDEPMPPQIVVEKIFEEDKQSSRHRRFYSIRGRRVIVVQWRFLSKKPEQVDTLNELVGRHFDFFVHSLRQKSESDKLELLMRRIFMDVTTILETAAKECRLNEIDLNVLIVDPSERQSIEGDFGGEFTSFAGVSEIENEQLFEIAHVLSSDRLVYRERARQLSSNCGWLFVASDRARYLLAKFARPEVAENYMLRVQSQKEPKGLLEVLDIPEKTPLDIAAIFVRLDE